MREGGRRWRCRDEGRREELPRLKGDAGRREGGSYLYGGDTGAEGRREELPLRWRCRGEGRREELPRLKGDAWMREGGIEGGSYLCGEEIAWGFANKTP